METSNGVDEMSNKGSGSVSDSGSNSQKNWQKCNCGHCWSHHMVLRWITGIVILLVVFGLGVMVGRFHSFGSRGMMMNRGGMYRQGMPMMRYPGSNGGMMQNGTMPMSASTTPTTTAK